MNSFYNRRNENNFNLRCFSLRKILLLTVVTLVFLATNPANDAHATLKCASRISKRKKKRGGGGGKYSVYSWNFFGISVNDFVCPITDKINSLINSNGRYKTKSMETNYGIFSAWTEWDTGVHLGFLLQDFTICENLLD